MQQRPRLSCGDVPAASNTEAAMYMVYWTVIENDASVAHGRSFDSDDMGSALAFMEELRTRQRAGEAVCFITMSSENPHSVGHPGVADPSPDYNWKKRRR